ncbi:hypothetical protein LJC11_01655 [Bacteroidales bacterium OttesenSCG-928-I21]|nr:hypothetical protein [Bacteroidales bacterium OttesenSCG-928-I21]
MNNENKMLRLVLSDSNLSSYYEYNADDFTSVDEALRSDNPIIVAVAKIIRGVNARSDKGVQKEVYSEVFNYLNQNIL